MKIGLAQLEIAFEDKKANQLRCIEVLESAAAQDVDLILFPEMTLTGFTMNADSMGELPGFSETGEFFKSIAEKFQLAIGYGWIERLNQTAKNKYTVVDCRGNLLSDYAKIHPFSFAGENESYTGGSALSAFSLSGLKIGTTVCYDLRFPELYQALSKTCDLITIAANWPESRHAHWTALLKARAIENQCFIAGVNITGRSGGYDYDGGSSVYDPYGNIITAQKSGPGLIVCEIFSETVTRCRAAFPAKDDRREDLYIHWMENSAD